MNKIEKFQITHMTISGFKSYQEPTEFDFGNLTLITGGNGRGKTSIADAIAFAVTGLPFFGKRGIDRLYNETNPDVSITMRFVDETNTEHTLTRTRYKDRMTITYDGYEIRQHQLTDLFGDRDVFLSIFNPLYFIEELGDSGKNLLEMYLPMIPHDAVWAELSDSARETLSDEDISNPEAYLKKRREEIRKLKEDSIYLNGQKDLVFMQSREQKRRSGELTQRHNALTAELVALEEKRFAGMDVAEMQDRLVSLSQQYSEMAADNRTDANGQRAELTALKEKIAHRKAEQYVSKFTQSLAEAEARIKDLGAQYKREIHTHDALAPGVSCPTCHRPVTSENLAEVQAAIKESADAILEAGKKLRTELNAIQEMDQQSRETFEQFKADDLMKWESEATALESSLQGADGNSAEQLEQLRSEIQSLTAEIEYGNLSQEEYDRLDACKKERQQCEAEQAAHSSVAGQAVEDYDQQIKDAEKSIGICEKQIKAVAVYLSERAKLTFSKLAMNKVKFSLYDVVKTTGELKDAFKFTYDGRSYDRLSLSEKIRAGMEVSELLKRLTGRNYPVFVDNMESVDDLANVRPTGQVIMAKCVHGAQLSVQPAGVQTQASVQSEMPTAA